MKRIKRERLEVVKEILGIILLKRNIGPTHLLYKANLSPQMFLEYKKDLIEKGLIIETIRTKKNLNGEDVGLKRKSYNLTELGRQYLEDYHAVENFIEKYGLNEE